MLENEDVKGFRAPSTSKNRISSDINLPELLEARVNDLKIKTETNNLYMGDNFILYLENDKRVISIEYYSNQGLSYIEFSLISKNQYQYEIGNNQEIFQRFTHNKSLLELGTTLQADLNQNLYVAIKESDLIPIGIGEVQKKIKGLIENIYQAFKSKNIREQCISKINDWRKLSKLSKMGETPAELSEEETEECIKILSQPDLLFYVKISMKERDVDKAVIGEHNSTLTLFLNCVGALNNFKTINTLKGSSSIGKTAVANMVTGLFITKKLGDLSPTALKYSGDYNYDILYLQESMDEDFKNKNFRLISSDDGGFIAETTIKDKESGEFYTQVDEIPAKTFVTTSTSIDIHDEYSTRSYIIPLDESKAQTEKIVKHNFSQGERLLASITGQRVFGDKYDKLKKALPLLEPIQVIIPYESLLIDVFPSTQLRARRDSNKLTQLIACSAFLFQYQRQIMTINGHKILFANIQDLFNVLKIAGTILESTITGFDTRTNEAMHIIPDIIRKKNHITSAILSKEMDLGTNYTSQILKQLRDNNYLIADSNLKEELKIKGNTIVHTINPDYESQTLISSIKDLEWLKFQKKEEILVNRYIESGIEYKGIEIFIDPITGEKIPVHSEDDQVNTNKEGGIPENNENPNKNLMGYFKDSEMVPDQNEFDVEQLAVDAFIGGDEGANDTLGQALLKNTGRDKDAK